LVKLMLPCLFLLAGHAMVVAQSSDSGSSSSSSSSDDGVGGNSSSMNFAQTFRLLRAAQKAFQVEENMSLGMGTLISNYNSGALTVAELTPAPPSMDRFRVTFQGCSVIVVISEN
ncbi:MAG: hypothetical protein AAF570_24810, partial [Bacteroidota bacterium]